MNSYDAIDYMMHPSFKCVKMKKHSFDEVQKIALLVLAFFPLNTLNQLRGGGVHL